MMKTIQMTIDETLLDEVDEVVTELGTNRSALMREALKYLLRQRKLKLMEEQHQAEYARQPLTAEEFNIWQDEQIWETGIESGRDFI